MQKFDTSDPAVMICDMRVEGMIEPMGVDTALPRFSWKMKSGVRGQKQNAYRIVVKSASGEVVWDSEVVHSDISVDIVYGGAALERACDYSWELTVYDKSGHPHTASSRFGTGLGGNEGFAAHRAVFISADCPRGDGDPLPALRKSFTVTKSVRSAKLYSAGLGVYETYINGKRVGKRVRGKTEYHELKPGFSEFSKRQYYSSFDIGHMLDDGQENVISVLMASGWWSGVIADHYGKDDAYCAVLLINYTDGTSETVVTDLSWRSACASPVLFADIFNGEHYDARVELSWMKQGFDDSAWGAVKENTEFYGELTSWIGSPITVHPELERSPISLTVYSGAVGADDERFGTINVLRTPTLEGGVDLAPGEVLLVDFGQNFAGWEAFTVEGERGTLLKVRHGEILNDNSGEKSRGNDGPGGSIYNANYRAAKAATEYTLRGGEPESYHPSFTFFGFRYIEITVDRPIKVHAVSGQVVSSVEKLTGFMETSNEKIDRLISNVRWGQLSNYLSVPTDCPQRNERQGWTGDTQAFCRTGCYMGYSKTFLEKFMCDLRDAQNGEGAYPGIAPTGYYHGADWGGTGWADCGIILPYTLYTMYGDVRIIEDSWESMEKYADDYLGKTELHGPRNIWGDWLAYESNDDEIQSMLAAAYYYDDARMMAEMAAVIDRPADIGKYKKVAELVKENFIRKYVKDDGTLVRGEQSVCLYALYLDMLPDERSRIAVAKQLTDNFERTGNRLQTGFLGTKIILDALTKIGRADIAYSLLLQEKNPSWLYSVLQGATTIWERWNSYTLETGFGDVGMNSFNHYAYGAVASWMFRTMAGICADPSDPAFKHALIAPIPDPRIGEVSASYESAYGLYETESRYEGEDWHYTLRIPANTTAQVRIPIDGYKGLEIDGKAPDMLELSRDCARFMGVEDGVAYFDVIPGKVEFVCRK